MSNENNKSFIMFSTWFEDYEDMSEDDKLAYIDAIRAYGFDGVIIPTRGEVRGRMVFVRRDIDAMQTKRAELSAKRSASGRTGGQHTQANASKNKQNEQTQANASVNVKCKIKKENKKEIIISSLQKKDNNESEKNTAGLIETLKGYSFSDEDIKEILLLSNYGEIGDPVWTFIYNNKTKLQAGKYNAQYLINYLKMQGNEQSANKIKGG